MSRRVRVLVAVPSLRIGHRRELQRCIDGLRTSTVGALPVAPDSEIEFTFTETEDEVGRAVRSAEILCANRLVGAWLHDNRDLKWVHYLSAGVDGLPKEAIAASGVQLTTSSGVHAIPVSEHALGMMLAICRRLPALLLAKNRREWQHDLPAEEMLGKTLLIIGLGHIGKAIARKAKCFGMRIWAVDPNPAVRLVQWVDEYRPPEQLADCLAEADIVAISAPLTNSTRGLIGAGEFQVMKNTAILINISRGSIVDEQALTIALETGQIQAAGLDVFETEPLPESSPLWRMENVIISPHVASMSPRYMERLMAHFMRNLERYVRGEPLRGTLDWSTEA